MLTTIPTDLFNDQLIIQMDTTSTTSSPQTFSDKIPSRKNVTNSKRKYFTSEEDSLLISAAAKYQHENWKTIAKFVPGKSPKQCRDRYINYLKPSLHFRPWNEEEDRLLVSLVNKYGTHWSNMAKQFPDRSTNSLKNRWNWLLKNNVRLINNRNQSNCDNEIIELKNYKKYLYCQSKNEKRKKCKSKKNIDISSNDFDNELINDNNFCADKNDVISFNYDELDW